MDPTALHPAAAALSGYQQRYQALLDRFATRHNVRWAFTLVLLLLYSLRVYIAAGWYVVSYGLGIYLLNLLIGFLSPRDDPAMGDDVEIESGVLPSKTTDDFRPFIRRIPEFKFWKSATHAIMVSLFLTMFEFFDVPVFWPLLLVYFLMLFFLTMKRQIMHMIEHRYLPFDFGKKKYKSKDSK
eukprot:TRINITY_DN2862_c0_g2_i2.p1 TRINITY_DN2862_c0_g2~~TRINITY_DN2862_c0_g2_i2.p1  ORF type:complete len:183 (-),score=36.42 TRINITY_DN2862_c0_g2_i2:571-1119(-)